MQVKEMILLSCAEPIVNIYSCRVSNPDFTKAWVSAQAFISYSSDQFKQALNSCGSKEYFLEAAIDLEKEIRDSSLELKLKGVFPELTPGLNNSFILHSDYFGPFRAR